MMGFYPGVAGRSIPTLRGLRGGTKPERGTLPQDELCITAGPVICSLGSPTIVTVWGGHRPAPFCTALGRDGARTAATVRVGSPYPLSTGFDSRTPRTGTTRQALSAHKQSRETGARLKAVSPFPRKQDKQAVSGGGGRNPPPLPALGGCV